MEIQGASASGKTSSSSSTGPLIFANPQSLLLKDLILLTETSEQDTVTVRKLKKKKERKKKKRALTVSCPPARPDGMNMSIGKCHASQRQHLIFVPCQSKEVQQLLRRTYYSAYASFFFRGSVDTMMSITTPPVTHLHLLFTATFWQHRIGVMLDT